MKSASDNAGTSAGQVTPLELVLHNRVGRAELNLPEAPQSVFLVLTNRSAQTLQADEGATIVLSFRPDAVRGLGHVVVAPESTPLWSVEASDTGGAPMLTLELLQAQTLAPGAGLRVHLQGVAAEPHGGTRPTRVDATCIGFDPAQADLVPIHCLLPLTIRRLHSDAGEQRPAALVEVPVAGPLSAGFTGGAGVLNGGAALNELRVRLVNTSGRPLRLAGGADPDDATRLLLQHRVGSPAAPWGLVGYAHDHLEVTTLPEGWVGDGLVLRPEADQVLARDGAIEFVVELHTTATSCAAALAMKVQNLPDEDDLELVLLAQVGPTATTDAGTSMVKPLRLWGGEARIDFHAGHATGSAAAAPPPAPHIRVIEAHSLALAAESVRVVDHRPGSEEAALTLAVGAEATWVRSIGRPLRIDAGVQWVSIEAAETTPGLPEAGANPAGSATLSVVGRTEKTHAQHMSVLAVTTREPAKSAPFGLDIGINGGPTLDGRAVSMQSTEGHTGAGGKLLLQPGGGRVGIGSQRADSALSVTGDADVAGRLSINNAVAGNALSVQGNVGVAGRIGVGTDQIDSALVVAGECNLGGLPSAQHVVVSGNQIQQVSRGTAQTWNLYPSALSINLNGGDVILAGSGLGNVGIGTPSPQSALHVSGKDNALRLQGTGAARSQAKLNFGDLDYVYLQEFQDDWLRIHADKGIVLTGGKVGIGTTNPTRASLQIDTYVPFSNNNIGAELGRTGLWNIPGGSGHQNTLRNVSLHCNGTIVCGTCGTTASDARIKNVEGRSDGSADLAALLGIEITDYVYKDSIGKGSDRHKKVIAQQVERVYPQAVHRYTDVVPDIYRHAAVAGGWVKLATDLQVGERVRLIAGGEEAIHDVLEVREGAFCTAFAPAVEELFVYGREVDDFGLVDYEAIAMLNVSATQELARRLAAKDAEIAALQSQLASQGERLQQFEARLARLEQAACPMLEAALP